MNLKAYLLIFQLEAYKVLRFLRWVAKHHIGFKPEKNKEPVWTDKAKQLYWLAKLLFFVISMYFLLTAPLVIALVIMGILWLNSYILLILALGLIRPYEIINRLRVKYLIKSKVSNLKEKHHLQVIGITGSAGKTSSKIVIGQLLPKCHITPKSYNTMFGIFKTVDYELNKRYRFFVCEMGAYKRGDVKEFCQLVNPDIGVLTAINEQHLERFGSIENTIQAKFEILTTLHTGAVGILNLDNDLVRNNLPSFQRVLAEKQITLIGYSLNGHTSAACNSVLSVKNWRIENGHTVFELVYDDRSYELNTPLIGRSHLSNIVAAIAVGLACDQKMEDIILRVSKVKQIPHRLELRTMPGITILDDTYSSNPTGFREALDTLNHFPGHKILITPGIVELGERALEIHKEIGGLAASICDEIVLVGTSKNLQAMKESILSAGYAPDKITQLAGRANVPDFLRTRVNATVLMENDLPDQYL